MHHGMDSTNGMNTILPCVSVCTAHIAYSILNIVLSVYVSLYLAHNAYKQKTVSYVSLHRV